MFLIFFSTYELYCYAVANLANLLAPHNAQLAVVLLLLCKNTRARALAINLTAAFESFELGSPQLWRPCCCDAAA